MPLISSLTTWAREAGQRVIDRLSAVTSGQAFLLGLAVVIGLFTGGLAALLIAVIDAVSAVAWTAEVGWLELLVLPTVGGFVVGLLLTYFFEESSGSGVIETMRTIAMRGGRFRTRVPLGGIITSGLALGTGAAGGGRGRSC
ncbi:MAG: hypothetical protein R3320_05685 [Nitriliruptorales bacterium]|nr:hypothetical protein [Nitriliruptorales bacterium]